MGAGIPSGLIGGAIALGLLIGGTWWFGGVLDAKDEAFGDVPAIHPEMRGETTRKGAGGGGCAKAGRLGESHSHIQTSSVSHSGQGS